MSDASRLQSNARKVGALRKKRTDRGNVCVSENHLREPIIACTLYMSCGTVTLCQIYEASLGYPPFTFFRVQSRYKNVIAPLYIFFATWGFEVVGCAFCCFWRDKSGSWCIFLLSVFLKWRKRYQGLFFRQANKLGPHTRNMTVLFLAKRT